MSTQRPAKIPRYALRNDSIRDGKAGQSCAEEPSDIEQPDCELTYDVLTIIFKNLNARDLRNAARVCRCWSEAAEKEKRLRGRSALRLFGDFAASWRDLYPDKPFVDRLRIKPMLGLIFTRPFDDVHPAKSAGPSDKADCFCGVLPMTCPNVIVGNDGIVSDHTELEENPQKAVCMFFPEERGVTVQTICVPIIKSGHCMPARRRQSSKSAKSLLKEYSMAKNKVKCVIFLSDSDVGSYDALRHMPCDRERTLCGGVAANLAVCKRDESGKLCNKPVSWICILISGASVRSWTVVLKERCDTKEKVETKLQLLRKQVQLRKHSMGFMFACQGRGEYMFGEKNVESSIFKKLFPEVPLIGSFGRGEYGDSNVERIQDRRHQYSTVFMILTYG